MLDTSIDPRGSLESRALSILLANDPWLIGFLMTPNREGLNGSPDELVQLSKAFSRGQQVLVQVALDYWTGERQSSITDVLCCLDSVRFEGFLRSLEFLRFTK
jgi:hypothetical protein